MGFPSEMCDVRGASGIILGIPKASWEIPTHQYFHFGNSQSLMGNPNSPIFSLWEFPKPHGKSQLGNS
jgi:hypothetical protein